MIINEYIYASNGSYIDVTITGRNNTGGTVTATLSGTSYTATTDNDGKAMIPVDATGTYSVSYANGDSTASGTVNVSVLGFTYPITLSTKSFTYSMDFDADVFRSNPSDCLTYSDDCAGFTPVSSPPSTLGTCQILGDWQYGNNGISSNKLLNQCFYATFKDNGNGLEPYEKLNPNDLTQKIAEYDPSTKTWIASSGASSITTYDTMFCIPTIYISSTATKLTLSDDSTSGTAYAHTIDSHTYEYMAIGVYNLSYQATYLLFSKSGGTPFVTNRPTYRQWALNKTVRNGHVMIWNFHQWQLWKELIYFATKSFNAQSQIGIGNYPQSSVTGHMDTMGPFAGSTSTDQSASNGVKAFIEDPWAHNWEFEDDCVNTADGLYAGQNSAVTDNTNDKTLVIHSTIGSSFPNVISTDAMSWGIGTADGGSSTTGLCDEQWWSTSTDATLLSAGSDESPSSVGDCGPARNRAVFGLSWTLSSGINTRLAFVFDL